MVTLAGVFAWIRNLWTATQVEFHGQYSLERLRNYNAYTTTASSARVFAACLLTPFPCLVQISLIDAVPLERPDKGANANYVHWVRNFACQFLMTAMMLGQFRLCVPRLSLGIYRLVVTSVVATIGSVGFQFLMSCVVGFPLPFGIVAGTPLWFATLCIAFAYYFGTQLRSNARFRADLSNYFAVFTLQVLFTFVLPAYISGLQAIGPVAQNAYLILMPVIKIAFKNWMSKYLRDLDDKRPEIVIFAIEIFNALYVACCMQSAMSFSTTVVLILIDSFQAWLSIRDINLALDEMKVFMDAIPSGHPWERMSFVEIALVIIEEDEQLRTHPLLCPSRIEPRDCDSLPVGPSAQLSQVVPFSNDSKTIRTGGIPSLLAWKNNAKSMNGADINAFSDAQRLHFVLKATNLLFTTEFILLVEYTEVIIPIIYSTLFSCIDCLSSRMRTRPCR